MSEAPSRAKILLAVHSAKPGGAQAMALAEASGLADAFELVVSVPSGPLRQRFADHGRIVPGSPALPLWGASPWRWLLQLLRTCAHAVRLAPALRRDGVRAVVTSSTVLLAPVLAGRLAGVPVIVRAREEPLTAPGRPLFTLLESLADTVAAVSGAVQRHFNGRRRARVVVIPDGIALPEHGGHSRNGFGDPVRLCLVGSIAGLRAKGQDVAVEALGRLSELGVRASLDLVGPIESPDFAAELRSRADSLGVGERVRLVGAVENAGAALDGADVVLSCSRAESLGLVLIEALALETPVVATEVGGVPEVVTHGQTGLLVPRDDPGAVAAAVAQLAEDPAAARRMARRGREEMARRYSIETTVAALREELDRALSATSR